VSDRNAERIRRLAELAVRFGANVQPGQIVGITAYTGREEMTRALARAAYEAGARWVDVLTFDDLLKRERLEHAPEDSLDFVPAWMAARLQWLSDERAARITTSGPQDPHALDGIDARRAGRDLLPWLKESGAVINAATTNWTGIPVPTAPWAAAVYPDLAVDAALERLWVAVEHICRLDEPDPVAAWRERLQTTKGTAARLTARRFDAIRLYGPGTDLTIGLLPGSIWRVAELTTVDGVVHHPNLPSEEVFTCPDPLRVDGHVTMTMPRELYGAMIEGIRVSFENGRATQVNADRGEETLRSALAKDETASRLGELALVDGEGRIGQLQTVFYDTLIDENAASHIAFGNGLTMAVDDDDSMARVNSSGIHIDLMIGRPELDVDGVSRDGETVPLLRGGSWQL
jgi:aminopeptidase